MEVAKDLLYEVQPSFLHSFIDSGVFFANSSRVFGGPKAKMAKAMRMRF